MKSYFLLAVLLFPTLLTAEPKAVIQGPDKAATGDLVVLTTEGSTGDNYVWILPEKLQVLACDADRQIGFASGTPGTYTFTLIAADKEAAISYVTHTVVIGTPTAPDKPPTDPGTPTPAPNLAELTAISKAAAPTDPDTSVLLKDFISQTAANIDAMCAASACPSLAEAQSSYQQTIGNALGSRPRGSQTNWLSWRKAVDAKIRTLNVETIEQLKQVMLATVQGF